MDNKMDSMLNDMQDVEDKGVMLDSKPEEDQEEKKQETPEGLLGNEEKDRQNAADKKQPEPKSYLADDLEQDDSDESGETKPDRFIPVSEMQKKRQEVKDLKAKIAELEQKKQDEILLDDYDEDFKAVLKDPDELVDGKTAMKIAGSIAQRTAAKVREEMRQEMLQREAVQKAAESKKALDASEAQARTKFADYDAVISPVLKAGLMTKEEVLSIKQSRNPGLLLYAKCKERLSSLGIQPSVISGKKQVNTNQPDGSITDLEEQEEADYGIYSEVFKKKKSP